MLEALKVLLRNVWGGVCERWREGRVYGFILITLIKVLGLPYGQIRIPLSITFG